MHARIERKIGNHVMQGHIVPKMRPGTHTRFLLGGVGCLTVASHGPESICLPFDGSRLMQGEDSMRLQ